ncbi:MFS transporter [Aciduricibacillus chroicocephali]|uniref:MFS transporter n=1 Tax=Aciduricibacillus chroicocephali TaxID=3054939 RepID=A0ABY9KUY3_9BACI|nr:MFS transporter [Bacillaceae bacterium 44XB]
MRTRINALFEKKNMDKNFVLLLCIGGLYALGIFLSNTFVNVYMWKNSQSYVVLGIFNLAIYLFQPIAFMLAGKLAKKIDRVKVLRTGIVFLSLFFLAVLFIGEKAPGFSFILGSVLGVGYGFYWLAYNVLTFEITEPENRDFFNGSHGILESFAGMAGPLIAGEAISRLNAFSGYTAIFIASFFLFILAIATSFFLKGRKAEGQFLFGKVVEERRYNRKWRAILNAHFLQGLREGIYLFVISIWVYLVTKSELSLGWFNVILSGMSLVVYFCAARWITPQRRKKAILIGGIILFGSIFVIVNPFNTAHIYMYALLIGIGYPLLRIPYISLTYDVIGQARRAGELRIEYIVVRELYVNIGRIVSISLFIPVVYLLSPEKAIPYLLVIFGSGHLLIYFAIRKIKVGTIPGSRAKARGGMALDEKNR